MVTALRLLAAAALFLGDLFALLVFLVSFAGHPPYSGIGIAILPVTLLGGFALIGGAIKLVSIGTKGKNKSGSGHV